MVDWKNRWNEPKARSVGCIECIESRKAVLNLLVSTAVSISWFGFWTNEDARFLGNLGNFG